jgi:hypothetical protein
VGAPVWVVERSGAVHDTKAGHSGGKPIVKQIEDMMNELAFLFWQLGVTPRRS